MEPVEPVQPLVLVADDDPEFRKVIHRLLLDMNCRAEFTTTGAETMAALETMRIDLALLDLRLPAPTGYEILEMIRRNQKWKYLQVIVITGVESMDSAVKCIELGAQDYLTKPFEPTLLTARIRSCLERGSFRAKESAYLSKIEEQNATLAEGERYYRGVVEDQTELILRYGRNMILSFVNGAYCRFFGKPAGQLIGAVAFGFTSPEQRAAVEELLSRITIDNPTSEIEIPAVTPDGGTRWLQWTSRALYGQDGEIIEYQSVGRDVTGRRLMENALMESERNLNKAQQIAALGYLSWRPGSAGQIWSDQVYKIYGLDPGQTEPSSEKLLEMTDPADRDMVRRALSPAGASLAGFNIEFRVIRKDGESIYVSLHGEAVEEPDGEVRLEGVIQDVTKRKRAERALIIEKEKAEAATKMKDKFISLVSHDIRAPLGAVLGLLELVQEKTLSPEKERDFIRRASDNCQKLLRMVDNLLNLNSLRSGILRPEITRVMAREIVEAAWDKLRYLAARKDITISMDIHPNAAVKADFSLAVQALGNVLHNAIKFSHKGGVISVFQPGGEPDAIAIGDMGMGMDAQTMGRLFDHEARVSGQGTAGERGSGLGLALSQDIMNAHGGSITAESTPGLGSLFKVRFPEATPTLLIVDDDEDFRLLIRTDLEGLKVKIIEASGGDGAKEVTRREAVSLVITDYDMPGMNGVDLVDWIRKESRDPLVPVIMISVDADYKTKIKAMRFGVSDFLIKPVEKTALLDAVRRHVKNL